MPDHEMEWLHRYVQYRLEQVRSGNERVGEMLL
jgi:hypothetical protein